MKSRLVLIAVFLLSVTLLTPWAVQAVQPTQVRLSLDRVIFNSQDSSFVTVFVTVTGSGGRAVKDLGPYSFQVTEDGFLVPDPPHVEPFVVTDRGLGYAIVIDHRENLATSLTLVEHGLDAFISEMGPRYPGSIVSYADHPRVVVGPSRDTQLLASAVLALEPVSGPPRLYDGLLLGLQTLTDLNRTPGAGFDRRVIIILTEGLDQGSRFSLDAVEAKLLETEVSLFGVGYGAEDAPALKRLAELCSKSGGGYFFAPDPDHLRPCLLAITERLKNQYVLTYEARLVKPDGRKHRLGVQVNFRGQRGAGETEFISPALNRPRQSYAEIGLGAAAGLLVLVWVSRRFRR